MSSVKEVTIYKLFGADESPMKIVGDYVQFINYNSTYGRPDSSNPYRDPDPNIYVNKSSIYRIKSKNGSTNSQIIIDIMTYIGGFTININKMGREECKHMSDDDFKALVKEVVLETLSR